MAPVPHGGEAANTEGLASRQPGTRPSRGPRPLRRRQHTGPEPGAPGHGVLCSEHSWNRWTDFAPLTAAVAPTTASSRARRLIGGDRSPEFGREHSLSVEAFDSADESCSVLVDNTGGALELGGVADSSDEQWSEMYEGRRDLPWPGGDGVQPGPLRRRRATGGGRLRAGRCDGTSAGCGFRTAVPPPVAAG
jgi:hypothetical protein